MSPSSTMIKTLAAALTTSTLITLTLSNPVPNEAANLDMDTVYTREALRFEELQELEELHHMEMMGYDIDKRSPTLDREEESSSSFLSKLFAAIHPLDKLRQDSEKAIIEDYAEQNARRDLDCLEKPASVDTGATEIRSDNAIIWDMISRFLEMKSGYGWLLTSRSHSKTTERGHGTAEMESRVVIGEQRRRDGGFDRRENGDEIEDADGYADEGDGSLTAATNGLAGQETPAAAVAPVLAMDLVSVSVGAAVTPVVSLSLSLGAGIGVGSTVTSSTRQQTSSVASSVSSSVTSSASTSPTTKSTVSTGLMSMLSSSAINSTVTSIPAASSQSKASTSLSILTSTSASSSQFKASSSMSILASSATNSTATSIPAASSQSKASSSLSISTNTSASSSQSRAPGSSSISTNSSSGTSSASTTGTPSITPSPTDNSSQTTTRTSVLRYMSSAGYVWEAAPDSDDASSTGQWQDADADNNMDPVEWQMEEDREAQEYSAAVASKASADAAAKSATGVGSSSATSTGQPLATDSSGYAIDPAANGRKA